MKKSKKVFLFIINLFIVISTTIIAIYGFFNGAGRGQVGDSMKGWGYFKPYTIDSNIFLAICSVCLIVNLITKKKLSHGCKKLYYVGTVSITLTFLTVALFLCPSSYLRGGLKAAMSFFSKDMFFFHFFNPMLAVISLFLMKGDIRILKKDNVLALLPMAVYAGVYCYNVAIAKTWQDFYGFTFGGKMYFAPVAIVVMVGATYLIGCFFRKRMNKKK